MKILRLWFEDGRIYVTTENGETLYQSLKFYPRLLTATDAERMDYKLGAFGIHWEQIDEDMSYESFYYEETKEPANNKEKIKVTVEWCDKNFCATTIDERIGGSVVATHCSYEGVLVALREALAFHVEGCVADGDVLPVWLINGAYEFEVEKL